jgi:transposase
MQRPPQHLLVELEQLPKRQQRSAVLHLVATQRIKAEHAAWILSLSVRQIQRLKKRRASGREDWDQHGNSNRTPVNATGADVKEAVVDLARKRYGHLNDTQFHQALQENHGITLSRQTVRRILRTAGIAPVPVRRRRAKKLGPDRADSLQTVSIDVQIAR